MSVAFHPSPRRILVRGVNWLGDAVMTAPALLRLREKFPNAHIALLCPEKLRELWQHHPAINETISFSPEESVFAICKKLRAGKFDLALVLPNSPRSALEVFLARIPQRTGYARPWRNFFLTQTVVARDAAVKMKKRSVAEIHQLIANPTQNSKFKIQNSSSHQIHEYLHLAAALGTNPEPLPPQLFVTPEEIEVVKIKFGLGKISQPIFGLNPGAEYGPAKRWPADHFIATAIELQNRTNCIWLILGGKSDTELAAYISTKIASRVSHNAQPINHAGKTSLRELMALLKICRVILTNDTGPMHLAAALGTPVVAPFGSTSPELTGPGLPGSTHNHLLKSDAPCSPCFLRECPIDFRCMNGIPAGRAVEAVWEIHRRDAEAQRI
ncbi:MAG TPA: lipopolysaccharide heptosyltransferase II [Verrucomicrobiae bacterium]|jgi:heptosyltransferase-2